jgi:hypothetical protein
MAAIRMSGGLTIRHEVARTVKPAQTHAINAERSGHAAPWRHLRNTNARTTRVCRNHAAGAVRRQPSSAPRCRAEKNLTAVPPFADQLMLSEGGITLRM